MATAAQTENPKKTKSGLRSRFRRAKESAKKYWEGEDPNIYADKIITFANLLEQIKNVQHLILPDDISKSIERILVIRQYIKNTKIENANDKNKLKQRLKAIFKQFEKENLNINTEKDQLLRLATDISSNQYTINNTEKMYAENKDEYSKKLLDETKRKLEVNMNEFQKLLRKEKVAFYNTTWFYVIGIILAIIGAIFIVGLILGFIYAYHAESIQYSKTGEWRWGRIAKRTAMNYAYVAIFWSQYGFW